MEKVKNMWAFLENAHVGTFVSFEDWDSRKRGYASPAKISYEIETKSLIIQFDSHDDLEKHNSFYDLKDIEKKCFIVVMSIDHKNSTLYESRRFVVGIVGKIKYSAENYLLIDEAGFNFTGLVPPMSG
jgi:hypothetical protein